MQEEQFNKLSAGKIAGSNAGSVAVRLGVGGLHMTERLRELFYHAWRKKEFPQDIYVSTQKGHPEVFDRQDLFQKVSVDTEMTGRQ